MKKKLKELDNREVNYKYEQSRTRIKTKVNKVLEQIKKELFKLSDLNKKYKLNEFNQKKLYENSSKIVIFKEKLITSWEDSLKEN